MLFRSEFPNTELFFQLQRWVRKHTKVTTFLVGGRELRVPVRLGSACVSWINEHPDFRGELEVGVNELRASG